MRLDVQQKEIKSGGIMPISLTYADMADSILHATRHKAAAKQAANTK